MWTLDRSWLRGRVGLLAALAVGLLAGPSVAVAQELALSWDDCGGATSKTFACNTEVGVETIVVSFTPTFNFPKVAQVGVSMYVCFQDFSLPDWWQVLGSAGCRAGALTAAVGTSGAGCASIWDSVGGTNAWIVESTGVTTLNGLRFGAFAALDDSTRAPDLQAGRDYELMRLIIANTRTVGAGACIGCPIGARIGADYVWFFSTDGRIIGTSNSPSITWQVATTACRAITPIRNQTWGALKALYR